MMLLSGTRAQIIFSSPDQTYMANSIQNTLWKPDALDAGRASRARAGFVRADVQCRSHATGVVHGQQAIMPPPLTEAAYRSHVAIAASRYSGCRRIAVSVGPLSCDARYPSISAVAAGPSLPVIAHRRVTDVSHTSHRSVSTGIPRCVWSVGGVVIPTRPSKCAAHDAYARSMKYSWRSPACLHRPHNSKLDLAGRHPQCRVEVLDKFVGDHACRKPVLAPEIGQLTEPEAASPYPRSLPFLCRIRVNRWCNVGQFPHTHPEAPQGLYI